MVPAPGADEWLVSWVGRFRLAMGIGWPEVWRRLGLARRRAGPARPPATWWWSLGAAEIDRLRAASGLAQSTVRQMLPGRFVGTVLRVAESDRFGPLLEGGPAWAAGLVRSRDTACLRCLHEGGYWRTTWCLPWAVICVPHRAYLTRSCPHCGRRLLFAPVSHTNTRRGFCVHPHGQPVTVPVHDDLLVEIQRRVDQHANAVGDAGRSAARAWFRVLWSLVYAAAVTGSPDDLDVADDVVRARFADWENEHPHRASRPGAPPLAHFGTDPMLTAALLRIAASRGAIT